MSETKASILTVTAVDEGDEWGVNLKYEAGDVGMTDLVSSTVAAVVEESHRRSGVPRSIILQGLLYEIAAAVEAQERK